jgi:hypothetical protein
VTFLNASHLAAALHDALKSSHQAKKPGQAAPSVLVFVMLAWYFGTLDQLD